MADMTITVDMTPYQRASFTFGEDATAEAWMILEMFEAGDLTPDEAHHVIESLIKKATKP